MPHSAPERPSLSASLFFFLFVCLSVESSCLATALRPSFARATSGGRRFQASHCFYSISCHYQRRYDHRVHSAAGEQWRRQAVFSLACHLYCPAPLKGIKWGLSIRVAAKSGASLYTATKSQGHPRTLGRNGGGGLMGFFLWRFERKRYKLELH